jgi:cell division septum initiation protein DivIVA
LASQTDPPPSEPADENASEQKDETATPQAFKTVRRGFLPKEVDDFVLEIEAATKALEAQVRQARLARETGLLPEAEEATAPGQPSKRLAAQFSELAEVAERGARTMVSQARDESGKIRDDAERGAERIVAEARDDAKKSLEDAELFLQDAQDQASRTLSELAERREQMLGGLHQLQQRLLSLLPDLETALGSAAGAQGATASRDAPIPPPPPAP